MKTICKFFPGVLSIFLFFTISTLNGLCKGAILQKTVFYNSLAPVSSSPTELSGIFDVFANFPDEVELGKEYPLEIRLEPIEGLPQGCEITIDISAPGFLIDGQEIRPSKNVKLHFETTTVVFNVFPKAVWANEIQITFSQGTIFCGLIGLLPRVVGSISEPQNFGVWASA